MEAIQTIQNGLEAILADQKAQAETKAPTHKFTQSKATCCKFCNSKEHPVEKCKEADKYMLTGKCKQNVFGKLVLPSGAEVPHRIKGKTLRECFEEYHRRYPGQQAAQAYLKDLVSPQKLEHQGEIVKALTVMGMTHAVFHVTPQTICKMPRQMWHSENVPKNPQASTKQQQPTKVLSDPEQKEEQTSAKIGALYSPTQHLSSQSELMSKEVKQSVPEEQHTMCLGITEVALQQECKPEKASPPLCIEEAPKAKPESPPASALSREAHTTNNRYTLY